MPQTHQGSLAQGEMLLNNTVQHWKVSHRALQAAVLEDWLAKLKEEILNLKTKIYVYSPVLH